MNQLRRGIQGWNSKSQANVLNDMQATLVRGALASDDMLEIAIEGLLEVDSPPISPREKGRSVARRARGFNTSLQVLKQAGLKAVPVLEKHLSDFRMTRKIARAQYGYTWHLRVADVVGFLLDDLAKEPFAFDMLKSEGVESVSTAIT